MFDRLDPGEDDPASCADALVHSIMKERRAVAERFALVANWADLHCPGVDLPEGLPGEDVGWAPRREFGADGTPPVSPGAVVELGMLLQTTTGSAEALLRDVLELRHRLPAHWEAVLTGGIDGWKARQVVKATRSLTLEQALAVDATIIDAVVGLAWGRAKEVVEATLIAVDPEGHRARLEKEENRRFVSTRRRSNAAGLRTVVARCDAGGVARLEAMIAHLADLLGRAGGADDIDARRATALAMLANPAMTCVYLSRAQE